MIEQEIRPASGERVGSAPALWVALVRLWPVSLAPPESAALDGLRGVAVLLVIGYHILMQVQQAGAAWLTESHAAWYMGYTGVHLFFVLSGFLLFLPYARAIRTGRPLPGARKFYIRRALRILPAYWVSLALLVLILEPAAWPDVGLHLVMLHGWTWETRSSINAPYWTMAVETQFYLVLPLLAAFTGWLARARRYWLLAGVGLLTLAPAYSVLWWLGRRYAPVLLDHLGILEIVSFLGVFGVGMGCSLVYVLATGDAQPGPLAARLGRVVGASGLGLLGVYMLVNLVSLHLETYNAWFFNQTVGLGYGGILLGLLLGWPAWQRALGWPALRFCGVISYSLYIWNWPIYNHLITPLAVNFSADWARLAVEIGLTLGITFPVAFVFYHGVERPFIPARRAYH